MADSCLRWIVLAALHTLSLSLEIFHRVFFWFHCSRVPARLCQCIFTLDLRCDQQTFESAAKLDANPAFASVFALSFPIVPTCDGIHALIIWICGGNFFEVVKMLDVFGSKGFLLKLSAAEKLPV